jgi:hypothetical protein
MTDGSYYYYAGQWRDEREPKFQFPLPEIPIVKQSLFLTVDPCAGCSIGFECIQNKVPREVRDSIIMCKSIKRI